MRRRRGLSQGALDVALGYAKNRETFERPIIQHQGIGFMLADMESTIVSSRATLLSAARLKDLGLPYAKEASIAKLIATDGAMRVTTDAVQVLGGAATPVTFLSSASCARRRSCKFSRARTRFSES